MIRALGKWCQVGRRSVEKKWNGYSFFSKACPLKARQFLGKLNTAHRLRKTTELHLGHEERDWKEIQHEG